MMDNSPKTLKENVNDGRELGDNTLKKNKSPGKIIYFANGETMEECSSEEDDVEEDNQKPLLDTANLSWGNYLRSWALQIVSTAFFACDFLGGKFATFLGLNDAKYQYAVDEYYRTQNKKNESDEDGEKTPTTLNEKYHLEMKQLKYGSINCNNIPFLPQKDTVENVNELEEGTCSALSLDFFYLAIVLVVILPPSFKVYNTYGKPMVYQMLDYNSYHT